MKLSLNDKLSSKKYEKLNRADPISGSECVNEYVSSSTQQALKTPDLKNKADGPNRELSANGVFSDKVALSLNEQRSSNIYEKLK